jgi:outer membrane protein OmpA-like peptidoglycan-associated protein
LQPEHSTNPGEGKIMTKWAATAILLGLAGCAAPPPRFAESPLPGRIHHAPPAAEQRPEQTAPRIADVKPLGRGELTTKTVEDYMDAQEKELRAKLRGSHIIVSRIGDNIAVAIPADALFSENADSLSGSGLAVLARITINLRKFDSTRISVRGADAKETPAQQQRSETRAQAVRMALVADGIDSRRVETKTLGSDNLVQSRSRRIEIDISPRVKA